MTQPELMWYDAECDKIPHALNSYIDRIRTGVQLSTRQVPSCLILRKSGNRNFEQNVKNGDYMGSGVKYRAYPYDGVPRTGETFLDPSFKA
jgi:hypothetical protein